MSPHGHHACHLPVTSPHHMKVLATWVAASCLWQAAEAEHRQDSRAATPCPCPARASLATDTRALRGRAEVGAGIGGWDWGWDLGLDLQQGQGVTPEQELLDRSTRRCRDVPPAQRQDKGQRMKGREKSEVPTPALPARSYPLQRRKYSPEMSDRTKL